MCLALGKCVIANSDVVIHKHTDLDSDNKVFSQIVFPLHSSKLCVNNTDIAIIEPSSSIFRFIPTFC